MNRSRLAENRACESKQLPVRESCTTKPSRSSNSSPSFFALRCSLRQSRSTRLRFTTLLQPDDVEGLQPQILASLESGLPNAQYLRCSCKILLSCFTEHSTASRKPLRNLSAKQLAAQPSMVCFLRCCTAQNSCQETLPPTCARRRLLRAARTP